MNTLHILAATAPLVSCLPNPPVQRFVPRSMIPTNRYHRDERNIHPLLCCGESDVGEGPAVGSPGALRIRNPSPHSNRRADGAYRAINRVCIHHPAGQSVDSPFVVFLCCPVQGLARLRYCNTELLDVTKKREDSKIPLDLSRAVLSAPQSQGDCCF